RDLLADLERVAKHLGLSVQPAALGDNVSGLLVVENGRGMIGFSDEHPITRQRFTIAHEIGHFVMHLSNGSLFIDRDFSAVYRRDKKSETGEQLREIEANSFAAALLMPESLVKLEMSSLNFDWGEEHALRVLADKFQVSTQAMSLRLAKLGLLHSFDDPVRDL
ncbi:MAG: ImmA/IrrE family metallo-endopeptidase, partial [Chlorobia bacterium]|nr:ImmA/IrrE family metallo-endopeptidase [Fimbriimonadaceae bacterium]